MTATCQTCGCKLGQTARTPIDRSLGFTAMLELYPGFGQMADDEGAKITTRFLDDWYGSNHTDMWAYAREWVANRQRVSAGVPIGQPSYGPNADGNPYAQYTPEHRTWKLAQHDGRAAAQWVFDGTTDQATYQRFARGIAGGDPEVMDSVREPSLSGEFSGEFTEDQLMAEVGWVPHDGTDMRDALAEQYNQEVSAAFWHEVERLAREGAQP